MIEAQGGTCAVCSGKPEHVDHDHETGKVRGILCFLCNQALGNARDDIDVLNGLVAYLRLHGKKAPSDVVIEMFRHQGPSPIEVSLSRHLAS
jgi:hypothetical protein